MFTVNDCSKKSPSAFNFEYYFADDAQRDFPPLSSLLSTLESMLLFLFFLTSVFAGVFCIEICFHADLVPNNNILLIYVTQRKVIPPDVCLPSSCNKMMRQPDKPYLLKPLKTWFQISISQTEYSD